MTQAGESLSPHAALLALGLRLAANSFLKDAIAAAPEFVVPWNSFRRLNQARVYTEEYGISAYAGDSFHLMPSVLHVLGPLTAWPTIFTALAYLADLATALLLRRTVATYLGGMKQFDASTAQQYANRACLVYLLNPFSIGSSVVASISSFVNVFVALFLLALVELQLPFAAFCAVTVAFVYPYYLVLLGPLLAAAWQQHRMWATLGAYLASVGFYAVTNHLLEGSSDYVQNTFYFFWTIPDLTPNVGAFWYLFVFIFPFYRLFALWMMQIPSILPVAPLSIAFRKDPLVVAFIALGHVAVLSSYPSYGEASLLIATYFAFPHLLKHARCGLVTFGTISTVVVLSPIMWRLWMITGSGNANFYFGIVMVYILAMNYLVIDVILATNSYRYLEACKEAGIENAPALTAKLGFKPQCPFYGNAFTHEHDD